MEKKEIFKINEIFKVKNFTVIDFDGKLPFTHWNDILIDGVRYKPHLVYGLECEIMVEEDIGTDHKTIEFV